MSLNRSSKKNVGVIGLGIIGSRVAAALRQAGCNTPVWNRTPRSVPNFLGSPAQVTQACDVLQIFVSDANATMSVIDSIHPALTPSHIVMNHGTIGLNATLEIANRVKEAGAQFLDAPFTGSKGAAENKGLVYYIGGNKQTYERAKPILEMSSKAIVHVGQVGEASIVKLATNMISAATVQVLAEALAMVRRAGVRMEALSDAIQHNAMRSGVIDLKLPNMISKTYEPHFALKHMRKDIRLALQLAESLGLEMPATSQISASFDEASANGWEELDYSALAKTFE
jgi:3-hydroxyisobutyrate dehydrogenase-like beta-hydroxyacid dehydrogenase